MDILLIFGGICLGLEVLCLSFGLFLNIIFFPERKSEGEEDRKTKDERESIDWLLSECPTPGFKLATQACAPNRNQITVLWFIG